MPSFDPGEFEQKINEQAEKRDMLQMVQSDNPKDESSIFGDYMKPYKELLESTQKDLETVMGLPQGAVSDKTMERSYQEVFFAQQFIETYFQEYKRGRMSYSAFSTAMKDAAATQIEDLGPAKQTPAPAPVKKRDSVTSQVGKRDSITSQAGKRDSLYSQAGKRDSITSQGGKRDSLYSQVGKRDSLYSQVEKQDSVTSALEKQDSLTSPVDIAPAKPKKGKKKKKKKKIQSSQELQKIVEDIQKSGIIHSKLEDSMNVSNHSRAMGYYTESQHEEQHRLRENQNKSIEREKSIKIETQIKKDEPAKTNKPTIQISRSNLDAEEYCSIHRSFQQDKDKTERIRSTVKILEEEDRYGRRDSRLSKEDRYEVRGVDKGAPKLVQEQQRQSIVERDIEDRIREELEKEKKRKMGQDLLKENQDRSQYGINRSYISGVQNKKGQNDLQSEQVTMQKEFTILIKTRQSNNSRIDKLTDDLENQKKSNVNCRNQIYDYEVKTGKLGRDKKALETDIQRIKGHMADVDYQIQNVKVFSPEKVEAYDSSNMQQQRFSVREEMAVARGVQGGSDKKNIRESLVGGNDPVIEARGQSGRHSMYESHATGNDPVIEAKRQAGRHSMHDSKGNKPNGNYDEYMSIFTHKVQALTSEIPNPNKIIEADYIDQLKASRYNPDSQTFLQSYTEKYKMKMNISEYDINDMSRSYMGAEGNLHNVTDNKNDNSKNNGMVLRENPKNYGQTGSSMKVSAGRGGDFMSEDQHGRKIGYVVDHAEGRNKGSGYSELKKELAALMRKSELMGEKREKDASVGHI